MSKNPIIGDTVKRLFNEAIEDYNDDGRVLRDELYRALEPLFAGWVKAGYSAVDLALVGTRTVGEVLPDVLRQHRWKDV